MSKRTLIKRFLIWKYKNISQKNFVYLLSVAVGLLAGVAAVTLKNITYTIQSTLKDGIVFSQNQLYFVLPIIGLFIVYVLKKFFFKKFI